MSKKKEEGYVYDSDKTVAVLFTVRELEHLAFSAEDNLAHLNNEIASRQEIGLPTTGLQRAFYRWRQIDKKIADGILDG